MVDLRNNNKHHTGAMKWPLWPAAQLVSRSRKIRNAYQYWYRCVILLTPLWTTLIPVIFGVLPSPLHFLPPHLSSSDLGPRTPFSPHSNESSTTPDRRSPPLCSSVSAHTQIHSPSLFLLLHKTHTLLSHHVLAPENDEAAHEEWPFEKDHHTSN